jgi:hypothetical protein
MSVAYLTGISINVCLYQIDDHMLNFLVPFLFLFYI